MFYLETPIRFQCTGCGKCCTGNKDAYVEVSAKEQKKIEAFLDISPAWFRRRYLSRFDDGDIAMAMDADGRCPFLDKEDRCPRCHSEIERSRDSSVNLSISGWGHI